MKAQLMGMLLAPAVAAVLPVAAALADDMPFWGEEPDTNRTAAVSLAVPIAKFSSQQCFFREYAMGEFDSRKNGLTLVVF